MKRNGLSLAVRSAVLSSTMILAACGSGGGSKQTPVEPVPVVPPAPAPTLPSVPEIPTVYTPQVYSVPNLGAPVRTSDPLAYAHLRPTHVDQAHSQGLTGKGVKIGVVDTDPNVYHPTLQGQIAALTNTVNGNTTTSISGPESHGTVVSQILVGKALGMFQGGVAPDATLYAVGASVKNDGKNSFPVSATIQANEWLATQNVAVVNNSWNSDPVIDWRTESKNWSTYATSAQKVINSNAVMVYANGNSQATQPGVLSILPLAYTNLERGWLTVSSYDTTTQSLAKHSNACGLAQNWCLVAPGTILAYDPTSSAKTGNLTQAYQSWMGTSFAAPQVSGTVALVAQAYPWMSNNQIRHTILGTATDLGAPGVDDVFGYGLLDASAAVNGMRWLNWGTEQLNIPSGEYTFANNMFGAGGVIKLGSGGLKFSGTNTYTGATTINEGMLSLTGSSVSETTVNTSGHFKLSGTLNAHLLNAGQSTFVGGYVANITQTPTGTWNAVLGAPLTVGGTANLGGSLVVVDKASRDYIVQSTENIATAQLITGSFASTQFAAGLLLNGTVRVSPSSIDVDIQRVSPTSLALFQSSPLAQELGVQLENTLRVADNLAATTPQQRDFLSNLAAAQSLQDPQQLYAFSQMYSPQPQIAAFNTVALVQHAQDGIMHDRLPSSLGEKSGAYASFASDDWSHTPNGWMHASLSSSNTTVGADWSDGQMVLGANGRSSSGSLKVNGISSKLDMDALTVYAGQTFGNWNGLAHISHGEGRWKHTTNDRLKYTSVGLDLLRPISNSLGVWTPSVSWRNSRHNLKARTQFENTGFEMGFESPSLTLQSWSVDFGFKSLSYATSSGWNHTWGGNVGWETIDQHNGEWKSYYLIDPSRVVSHNYHSLDDQQWKVGAQWEAQKQRYKIYARWDGRYGSSLNSHGWQIGARLAF